MGEVKGDQVVGWLGGIHGSPWIPLGNRTAGHSGTIEKIDEWTERLKNRTAALKNRTAALVILSPTGTW
jgi:hypothetical protein